MTRLYVKTRKNVNILSVDLRNTHKMDFYKTKDFKQSVSVADEKKRYVEGYFASFDTKDSDGDIIVRGAFKRTIEELGPFSAHPRIKHVMDHDMTQPLGRLVELKEDDKGLFYRSEIGSHAIAKDFWERVKSELITEHSIGYWPVRYKPEIEANYLVELGLKEGSSLNYWAANPFTPLTAAYEKAKSKKSFLKELEKRAKKLQDYLKTATAEDEILEALTNEYMLAFQFIADNKSTLDVPETQGTDKKQENEQTDMEALGLLLKLKSMSNTFI